MRDGVGASGAGAGSTAGIGTEDAEGSDVVAAYARAGEGAWACLMESATTRVPLVQRGFPKSPPRRLTLAAPTRRP